MAIDPLAGKPAPANILIDPAQLENAYYTRTPNLDDLRQLVSFGTSGHRGTPLDGSFTEAHIIAITKAICDYRKANGITGPLFMGMDTHCASAPAQRTALEVLAAHSVATVIQEGGGFTPTPSIARMILAYNRADHGNESDGILITPSHNPPEDGGFKYNPPNGGPADTNITAWIQKRANNLLREGVGKIRRIPYERALTASSTHAHDFRAAYVDDLANVIDMEAIRSSGLKLGVDPLGGAAVHYWDPLREKYGLNLEVVNPQVDPTFSFMTVDHDGKIRMDCSSPFAMARLVELKDLFGVSWANDPDSDRHGIVTPSIGLMNPNYYLAVAIGYLIAHRAEWSDRAAIGKTLVSSSLIDRVVRKLGRQLLEVPVGFKWFVPGLFDGTCCFGGEESAGASFLRRNATTWTTDKDGLILGLLAAEITAVTGRDPGEHQGKLFEDFGETYYTRIDTAVAAEQKPLFAKLDGNAVRAATLVDKPITAKLTEAPGNHAPLGGVKVVTADGWFAVRPSGTEDIYKLYAESFVSRTHLDRIVEESEAIVREALATVNR
jgi:phosphoglucomutase